MRVETVRGAMAGCDRFGLDTFNPTADRVRTIAALRAPGCAVDALPALREHGVDEAQITAMWSTTAPATSPEARSEPNGSYRDFPQIQPLPASGCSG
jgi:predicted metal-dependent phosphotriesterase family hydrolase